jgi:hypothetical protein
MISERWGADGNCEYEDVYGMVAVAQNKDE